MPYIEAKVTAPLSPEKKEALKHGFGELITLIPGKTEAVTMIRLEGGCDLYMDGRALDSGAYVEIRTFGEAAREHKTAVTEAVFRLLESVLGVPKNQAYVTFSGHGEWGCDGGLL